MQVAKQVIAAWNKLRSIVIHALWSNTNAKLWVSTHEQSLSIEHVNLHTETPMTILWRTDQEAVSQYNAVSLAAHESTVYFMTSIVDFDKALLVLARDGKLDATRGIDVKYYQI